MASSGTLAEIAAQITAQNTSQLSTAQRCRRIIITAIKQGILPPGHRLIEADLCHSLSVSRTPLREALAALRADGVIEADNQMIRVRQLAWRDIDELYEMRALLEGAAAKYAARHASDAEKDLIAALVTKEAELVAMNAAPASLAEHNRQFHYAILQAARNSFLKESLQRLSHLLILIGDTAYHLPDRTAEIQTQHAAITRAIKNSDEAAAEQAMRDHLRDALQARLRLLSQDEPLS